MRPTNALSNKALLVVSQAVFGLRAIAERHLYLERRTNIATAMLAMACLVLVGCGSNTLPAKAVFGSVTCDGQPVPTGQVTFMPIEGTPGPNTAALIVDGQYRITARGGVALGKHRVCVDARKKTGRQVQGYNGHETTLIDETVRMGPEIYNGEQSPIITDIQAGSDARFDITIPRE